MDPTLNAPGLGPHLAGPQLTERRRPERLEPQPKTLALARRPEFRPHRERKFHFPRTRSSSEEEGSSGSDAGK